MTDIQRARRLRQMSRTVEDIEDAKTIERAKRANGSKPRIAWSQVKKELQLDQVRVCSSRPSGRAATRRFLYKAGVV